tara:strand:- start:525 stop:740 length:216 start_codon:yes stop_codon:yes gene_type:complete
MIIRKTNVDVVHVHTEKDFWTIVRSYHQQTDNNPTYTAINERAEGKTEPYITTREGLKKMFNHDVIALFEE